MYLVCNSLLKNTPKFVYINHSWLKIMEFHFENIDLSNGSG